MSNGRPNLLREVERIVLLLESGEWTDTMPKHELAKRLQDALDDLHDDVRDEAEGWPWQRIETAPKTGRTLLLGYFNSHQRWRTVRGQWMSAEYIADCWEEPENREPGWFETAEEADDVPNCWAITPTHWLILPGAPGEAPAAAVADAQPIAHKLMFDGRAYGTGWADGAPDAATLAMVEGMPTRWTIQLAYGSPTAAAPDAYDCCANCLRPKAEHHGDKCPPPNTTVWHAWDYDSPPDSAMAASKGNGNG